MTFGGTTGHRHYRPHCGSTTELDMVLIISLCLGIILASGGSIGHSDGHGSSSRMALGHQCGPRWQPRPLALPWPLMISGTADNKTNPGCSRVTDTDMALSWSSAWTSPWQCRPLELYGPGCSKTLKAVMWPQVMDINTDSGCCRVMDPDLQIPSPRSLGLDIIFLLVFLSDSTGHSDQHIPSSIMALGHQNDHRWWPRPWAFSWTWWSGGSWMST